MATEAPYGERNPAVAVPPGNGVAASPLSCTVSGGVSAGRGRNAWHAVGATRRVPVQETMTFLVRQNRAPAPGGVKPGRLDTPGAFFPPPAGRLRRRAPG